MDDAWYTAFDVNRNRGGGDVVFGHIDLHDAGLTVQGLLLVKDEVADAVIDVMTAVVLNGL